MLEFSLLHKVGPIRGGLTSLIFSFPGVIMKMNKVISFMTGALLLGSSVAFAQEAAPAAAPAADCKTLTKELKAAKKDKAKVTEIKKQMKDAGCKMAPAKKAKAKKA